MKRLMIAALLASAALAGAPAQTKKELLQKLMVLQEPAIDQVARGRVERPGVQMMPERRLVPDAAHRRDQR